MNDDWNLQEEAYGDEAIILFADSCDRARGGKTDIYIQLYLKGMPNSVSGQLIYKDDSYGTGHYYIGDQWMYEDRVIDNNLKDDGLILIRTFTKEIVFNNDHAQVIDG